MTESGLRGGSKKSPDFKWPLLPETERVLTELERAVSDLIRLFPPPVLRDGIFEYEEKDQDWRLVATLKAVRITSGLRATKLLGEEGQTHEMAVLLRTVDDFLDEILFLLDGFRLVPPAPNAKRFVDDFFAEKHLSTSELKTDRKASARIERRKIRAAAARELSQESNPDSVRRMSMGIDDVFSSYVHGGYPAVMELYGSRSGFSMRGREGSDQHRVYYRHLALYTYRALVVVGMLAARISTPTAVVSIANAAERFMKSSEYPLEAAT